MAGECARNVERNPAADIQVKRGLRFRGQVVLSDGKPIPPGMRIIIGADHAWDSQEQLLAPDGRFEFIGVPSDRYSVAPAVKGYRAEAQYRTIEHDIDDCKVVMVPVSSPPGRP